MNRRIATTSALTAVAAAAAGLLLAGTPALAEPRAATAPAASAAAVPDGAEPLRELRTADNRGTFYTLSADEARVAVERHGFRETGEAEGLFLLAEPADGAVPVYRLRLRDGAQTYLVSVSRTEIDRLADPGDPDRRFENEGVLGYVYTEQQPGTVALHRFSRNSDWRLGKDTRQDLLRAGYADDGVIGWVPAE